jgi:hypothetical protein
MAVPAEPPPSLPLSALCTSHLPLSRRLQLVSVV